MEKTDTVLIIGADGLIGQALSARLLRYGKSVLETTRIQHTISERRNFLDLADDVSSWHPPCHVSLAYLCAAVDLLEQCRREPTESAKVNVHNTVKLAKMLVARNTFVIFPSSNLVYDGTVPFQKADAPLSPRTEHGRQKAEAERQLLALGDLISVVRFTKIFGPNMPLFESWISALKNSQPIHPFSDKVVSPLPLSFAVAVLHRIAEMRLKGIVQVSAERDVTYEEIGRQFARRLGVNQDLIQPMSSETANLEPGAVPTHTTLDTTRLVAELGMKPPDVYSTIDLMISQNINAINLSYTKGYL